MKYDTPPSYSFVYENLFPEVKPGKFKICNRRAFIFNGDMNLKSLLVFKNEENQLKMN